MTRYSIALLLTVALAGCYSTANPKLLAKTATDELCEDYYFGRHKDVDPAASWPTKQQDIKNELSRRQAVGPNEWPLIDTGQVKVSDGECALKAAWGYPLRVDHLSAANGEVTHYVYASGRYADVAGGVVVKVGGLVDGAASFGNFIKR